jgi:hypothetical protein
METKKLSKRRIRISASVPATLKKRLRQASSAQSRTMSEVIADALESNLPDLPMHHKPKGRTWVDDLAGTASFTDAELAGDERLERLVKGARTKAKRIAGGK